MLTRKNMNVLFNWLLSIVAVSAIKRLSLLFVKRKLTFQSHILDVLIMMDNRVRENTGIKIN